METQQQGSTTTGAMAGAHIVRTGRTFWPHATELEPEAQPICRREHGHTDAYSTMLKHTALLSVSHPGLESFPGKGWLGEKRGSPGGRLSLKPRGIRLGHWVASSPKLNVTGNCPTMSQLGCLFQHVHGVWQGPAACALTFCGSRVEDNAQGTTIGHLAATGSSLQSCEFVPTMTLTARTASGGCPTHREELQANCHDTPQALLLPAGAPLQAACAWTTSHSGQQVLLHWCT
jgi:hypothetical protein